jgi:hypothetical protein
MPSVIRTQIFFVSRAITLRPRSKERNYWRDLEESPLWEKEEHPATGLIHMLQSDGVSRALYSHLHVDDVANISRMSRAMRFAVFSHTGQGRAQRRELICEMACTNGEKTECWGCMKVICDVSSVPYPHSHASSVHDSQQMPQGCKSTRGSVPVPRTDTHLRSCFALCTRCYIRKSSAVPAPFSATWRPDNLATQHLNCSADSASLKQKGTLQVDACRSCARLTPEQLQAQRERRDEAAIKLTLTRRVMCFECARPIPGRKRRWWICALGPHECHWAGHEAAKQA